VLVAAWFALGQLKNESERSMLRWPPGDGETSRLGARDPVAHASVSPMVQEEQDEVVNMKSVQWWRPSQGMRQD
jgi:hypothetical protein